MLQLDMPPCLLYPREMCEADAMATGLEADALYAQVSELCSTISAEMLDVMLLARKERVDGLSRVDKARLLVGVPVKRSAARMQKLPAVGMRGIDSTLSAAAAAAASVPPSAPSSSLAVVPRVDVTASAAGADMTDADDGLAALEQSMPCESSTLRRKVQHLTAVMQPLIAPLAQSAALAMGSGVTGSSVAQGAAAVGAAGVAAVGGLTQSMAVHEHHTQAQEMSRRLQRVAMEQDRTHHAQAQGLNETLAQRALEQEVRQHRQGLWREAQQHQQAIEQDRHHHQEGLRVRRSLAAMRSCGAPLARSCGAPLARSPPARVSPEEVADRARRWPMLSWVVHRRCRPLR